MTAGRVPTFAAPGTMFKRPRKMRGKRRATRDHDDKHLAAVRCCPCLACDNDPAREAAHVSMSNGVKPMRGLGMKADDRWTLPLCRDCHTRRPEAQHNVGEVRFWKAIGLDPLVICERLYAVSPNVEAMRAVIFSARENRT